MFEAFAENFWRDLRQLGLRIVEVEEVDGFETEVLPRALNLVTEVLGGHAVHAANDFLGIDDPAFEILAGKITARIGWQISVEGKIAGLGGNENFRPGYVPGPN